MRLFGQHKLLVSQPLEEGLRSPVLERKASNRGLSVAIAGATIPTPHSINNQKVMFKILESRSSLLGGFMM